jgi:hypothetical protein
VVGSFVLLVEMETIPAEITHNPPRNANRRRIALNPKWYALQ